MTTQEIAPARPTIPAEFTIREEDELVVVDLFCGAGGSSTGAQKAIEATGRRMRLAAINHWNIAIQTHAANHPEALHVVEDVSIVKPEDIVPDGYVDILMASPECTHHSRARGGKPIHDQGRMNPWAIMNWLTRATVRTVLVENVPEFTKWGPLDQDGHPIKARESEYFQAWFMAFAALGYEAQWRFLNAADYGDATSRTRFFLMARRDGHPIRWPEPTHERRSPQHPLGPGLKPWRGAREIIDWSNPGASILDHPKYRRKQLALNTRKRIARGLEKYGGPLAPFYIQLLKIPDYAIDYAAVAEALDQPFVLNRNGENGTSRAHSIELPIPTSTTRGAGYLVVPLAEHRFIMANRSENAPKSMDEPIPPATTAPGGGSYMVEADAKPFTLPQHSCGVPRDIEDPTSTITTRGAISLINPMVMRYNGQSIGQTTDAPLSTIMTCRKHALINPLVVQYYGKGESSAIEAPLPCITTKDRHGLANPVLIQANHGNGHMGDRGNERRVMDMDNPVCAITTRHGIYLAEPYIVPNFGEAPGQEPRTHDIDTPVPAVTSRGAGNLICPVLTNHQGEPYAPERILIVNGVIYVLDIRYRMLQNRELARATGFDDDEIRYHFAGTKTQITKQIGNAVPVHMATALVAATLSHLTDTNDSEPRPA